MQEIFFYDSFPNISIFRLILFIQNSRFQIIIDFDRSKPFQFINIGHGFNDDRWHYVRTYLNLDLGFFNIRINSTQNTKFYKSVYFDSKHITENQNDCLNYRLVFGDSFEDSFRRNYTVVRSSSSPSSSSSTLLLTTKSFIGCLANILISRSSTNSINLTTNVIESDGIMQGCVDQCRRNLCSRRASCINHYDRRECNCFGTELEDWQCRSFNHTVITLKGFSSITYRIYNFTDRYHSYMNLISFHIRARHNGLIFVAFGLDYRQFLILDLINGYLRLRFDLGDQNSKVHLFTQQKLLDDQWHNVTLRHIDRKIMVHLEKRIVQIIALEKLDPFFLFDSEIYIGGLPPNLDRSKLNLPFRLSNRRFIGCLKHFYFNQHNILYDVHQRSSRAEYHGVLPLQLGCEQTESIPITIYGRSFISFQINRSQLFLFSLKFKSFKNKFKIIRQTFRDNQVERKQLIVSIRNNDVKLEIETIDASHNELRWVLSNDNSLNQSDWNEIVAVIHSNGLIEVIVNDLIVKSRYDSMIDFFQGQLSFGSIDDDWKFIGCIKDIYLNGVFIDPRVIDEIAKINGKISLDDCRLINPCDRTNPCEHDGVCRPIFDDGSFTCDCTNTGYIGRTCHFCKIIEIRTGKSNHFLN